MSLPGEPERNRRILLVDDNPAIHDDFRKVLGASSELAHLDHLEGLAIARAVVVDEHGRRLDFTTEVGVGTIFVVRLPIAGPAARAEAAA